MAKYRYMGHECPTCDEDVYGYFNTKIYCSDCCRSKFNKLKEKQLAITCEGMPEFRKKNIEVMNFTMGSSKNFFVAPLYKLQKKNFRPDENEGKKFYLGIKMYVVGNFYYFIKNNLVFVFRIGAVEELMKGIEFRWKLDFPEVGVVMNKTEILKSRELLKKMDDGNILLLSNEFLGNLDKCNFRKWGVWRI